MAHSYVTMQHEYNELNIAHYTHFLTSVYCRNIQNYSTILKHQSISYDDVKSRVNSENVCCHFLHNILSSDLLKETEIKVQKL